MMLAVWTMPSQICQRYRVARPLEWGVALREIGRMQRVKLLSLGDTFWL